MDRVVSPLRYPGGKTRAINKIALLSDKPMKYNTYKEIAQADYRDLKKLPEEEIDLIAEIVLDYFWQSHGFPYYEVDQKKIKKETKRLYLNNSEDIELENNELQQSMLGLTTCNMFHKEIYETKCNGAKSPMEIFSDYHLFKTAIKKRILYNDRRLNPPCVRRALTAFGGQAASNFRPSIAKWLYEKFGGNEANVLDPCAGYGGRLMGAYCSKNIVSYTGIDPNEITVEGNFNLFYNIAQYVDKAFKINFNAIPFENYETEERYDIIFTSPPYFDLEKYSTDNNQSYIKFPTYDLWREGFLKTLIKKSHNLLKEGGTFAINVGGRIVDDAMHIGSGIFFKEPEIYQMRLSKFLGQGNKGEVKHKFEPIFIWSK